MRVRMHSIKNVLCGELRWVLFWNDGKVLRSACLLPAASSMPLWVTRRPQQIGGVHSHASFLFARCFENGCLFLFMHCCVDVRSSWRA